MRPLNRPMFKMGGPVKEGIMDGIREPKANGGTIGGGTIAGQNVGKGRTGFFNPLLTSIGATGLAALRASPRFFKDIGKSIFTKPGKAGIAVPPKPDFFSFQTLRNLLPTQRFRTLTPTVSRTTDRIKDATGSYSPVKFTSKQLSFKEAFKDPRIIGQAIRENPFYAIYAPATITSAATYGGPAVKSILKTAIDTAIPGERFDLFKEKEDKDVNVGQRSTVGQRGKSGDTINQTTEKGNQFNDDGSKKETSVSRLLKAVEKRSRDAAVADSLIAAGEEIRTQGIDADTVGNITKAVSKEFDKDVDLRQKLDLARIESEFKKEQIAAQAIATDPVNIEMRKRKLTTIGDLDRADRGGVRYGVKGGVRLLAQDFEQLTGIPFQGSLGGDDELKKIADTEAFKINPESVIKDSIENIKTADGNIIVGENGTYSLGNQLYEYINGVVKRLK